MRFEDLRAANVSRVGRWHPKAGVMEWSLSDWGVAAGGEMGEALDIIKKLNRYRDGLAKPSFRSEEQLLVDLGKELADITIYLDLLALRAGIDLGAVVAAKFNEVSEKMGFPERLES